MDRSGFTLVEMTVALVILAVGILGIAATAGPLGSRSTNAEVNALALQAVNDRLALVMLNPGYGGLDTLFVETDTELPIAAGGYTRSTAVTRVVTDGSRGKKVDYTRVTVSVDGPMLVNPISRTLTVAAP